MRSVLGVDLGSRWQTIGSAVLSFDDTQWVRCTIGAIAWPTSPCDAEAIADTILSFALKSDISAISLDGPQGWRDPATPGAFVGRECERVTRTPGKTGTFGVAVPRTWIHWIQCSIEVFDRLLRAEDAVLANSPESHGPTTLPDGKFYVLECFPTSTWRQAGLRPLPGHGIDVQTIKRFTGDLQAAFSLPDIVTGSAHNQGEHDNLQALVAALPAAGLLGGSCRAVPKGLPARMIAGLGEIPRHRVEGIIWDAMPLLQQGRSSVVREAATVSSRSRMTRVADAKLHDSFMPDAQGLERGVRLFNHFTEASNRGDAIGISYGGFVAYLHNVPAFRDVAGRNFLPSDSMKAVSMAWSVTDAAGGRKKVGRSGSVIDAGMDTFIWNAKRPFDRPDGAWHHSIPYTREQWLTVFPTGARRLITVEELQMVARR